MILEHNTYKEAVSDVTLSEEAGMEMLENAIRKKERWSQKWRSKMVAAAAGIAVVALSANGICFAATGMNAWDLFQSLYKGSSKEAEVIAQNFQEVGNTLTDGNLQFTMEEYWYDMDNGMAYFTIRTDSLDGSPLNEADAEAYMVSPVFNLEGGMSVGEGKSVMSEDKTSIRRYHHIMIAYDDQSEPYYDPTVDAEVSTDALVVHLEVENGKTVEDGCETYQYRDIGSFALEPKDSMKMKTFDVDSSVLKDCTKITITGGGIKMYFADAYGEEHGKEHPFGIIELKMKDGTTCSAVQDLPEGDWEILGDEDGTITGYKSASTDISGDRYLGGFSSGSGFDGYSESGYSSEYICQFNRFIDIDDVAAVYVDGVELPAR